MNTAQLPLPSLHWEKERVRVELSNPPSITQMGMGIHGQHGIERYRLPDRWSMHLYRYQAALILNRSLSLPIRPGFVSVIPPNTEMEYHFLGRSTHLYAHFRLSLNANEEGTTPTVPWMQDLGDDFGRVFEMMQQVNSGVPGTNPRANARLWDILWQLTERHPGDSLDLTMHEVVRMAIATIESDLDSPLRSQRLAETVGVSFGYLSTLFRQSTGKTVVGYIRHRRMERAKHLLIHSTLPIKTIATMVGISDLQQFNKTVRLDFGVSPSDLRRHSE